MRVARFFAGFVLLCAWGGVSLADIVDVRFWLVRSDRIDTPTTFDPTQQDQDMTTTGYGGLYSETPDVYALEYNLATTDQFYYIFGKFDAAYAKGRKVQGISLEVVPTAGLEVEVTWYQFTGNDLNPDVFRWDTGSDLTGPRCKLLGVAGTGWLNDDTDYDTGDLYTPDTSFIGSSSICLGAVHHASGLGDVFLALSYDGVSIAGTGNTARIFFGDDPNGLPYDFPPDPIPLPPWPGPDGIAEGAFVPEPAAIGLMLGLVALLRRR